MGEYKYKISTKEELKQINEVIKDLKKEDPLKQLSKFERKKERLLEKIGKR